MPPWNRPKRAEITYSDASESNGRKSSSAVPWSTDPRRRVRSPPMRSQMTPETSRLTMPAASISESMRAPLAAP